MSNIIIIIVHAFFLFHTVLSNNNSDSELNVLKYHLHNVISDLFDSFGNFTENVRPYFKVPISIMEDSKTKIKRLLNFFHGPVKTSLPLTTTPTINNRQAYTSRQEPFILAPDMIIESGYSVQVHTVCTMDGYHLVLHRIPSYNKTDKVALLHHGLLGSSDDWLLLGHKKALPYLMSDAGYDVWLANARGNRYSKTHLRMPVEASSYEYWNFSWHEIGHYDLPAVIEYIRHVTKGSTPINFIGYSMGATALLVLLTTLPQYNAMLRCAILLGPLSYMSTVQGPFLYLADLLDKNGSNAINFIGKNEFMRNELYPSTLLNKFCMGEKELCQNPLLFLSNGGKNITNKYLKKKILAYVPAGGSSKTIVHYLQAVKSGRFQMFDYGTDMNMKKYGSSVPPKYRLNDVTVPVAMFTASDDWLSTTADTLNLIPNIPFALQQHVIKRRGFTHTDFVFSETAPNLVYLHVLKVLNTIGDNKNDRKIRKKMIIYLRRNERDSARGTFLSLFPESVK